MGDRSYLPNRGTHDAKVGFVGKHSYEDGYATIKNDSIVSEKQCVIIGNVLGIFWDLFSFPDTFFAPGKRGRNTAIFGPNGFVSAAHALGVVREKKQKNGLQLKKTTKISQQLSPTYGIGHS